MELFEILDIWLASEYVFEIFQVFALRVYRLFEIKDFSEPSHFFPHNSFSVFVKSFIPGNSW